MLIMTAKLFVDLLRLIAVDDQASEDDARIGRERVFGISCETFRGREIAENFRFTLDGNENLFEDSTAEPFLVEESSELH